jgi:hypothetical protein
MNKHIPLVPTPVHVSVHDTDGHKNDDENDLLWVNALQTVPAILEEGAAGSRPNSIVVEEVDSSLSAPAVPPISVGGKLGMKLRSKSENPKKAESNIVPIRLIVGFLPEVVERDALEYAVGVAERYFDQIGLAYFDAFPCANGFAFEVHEGGAGRAFLPEILKYFAEQGAYRSDNPATAVIKTATRMVEVQHLREGLTSVILSENTQKMQSPWLRATEKMQSAIDKRTGFFVASAAIFVTGFMAMIVSSLLTRYTPYLPPPAQRIEHINTMQLPKGQWQQLESIVAREGAVKALRFRNNKWETPELWPVLGASTEVSPLITEKEKP